MEHPARLAVNRHASGASGQGTWRLSTRADRVLKAIEHWASQSEDRVRLLVILMWVAFGVTVVGATVVAAQIMVPRGYWC